MWCDGWEDSAGLSPTSPSPFPPLLPSTSFHIDLSLNLFIFFIFIPLSSPPPTICSLWICPIAMLTKNCEQNKFIIITNIYILQYCMSCCWSGVPEPGWAWATATSWPPAEPPQVHRQSGTQACTVQKLIRIFSRYNMKCRGKRDTRHHTCIVILQIYQKIQYCTYIHTVG